MPFSNRAQDAILTWRAAQFRETGRESNLRQLLQNNAHLSHGMPRLVFHVYATDVRC